MCNKLKSLFDVVYVHNFIGDELDVDKFGIILDECPTVGILRGLLPEDTCKAAIRLWDSGIKLLEIPLHSPTSEAAFLQSRKSKTSSNVFLGVGSVRNLTDYSLATELGADFLVGPNLSLDVLNRANQDGVCYLPGVMSPTEVSMVLEAGQQYMKLFPASIFGPAGVSQILDPFPEARVIAVGGVTLENMSHYIERGAAGVGLGKSLVSKLLESHSSPEDLTRILVNHRRK